MDELEYQTLPTEPENMQESPAAEAAALMPEEPAAEIVAPEEHAAAPEPVVPEAPAAPEPVVPEVPVTAQPVQRPGRRSPYENSPYMMNHQPQVQTPPPPQPQAPAVPDKPKKKGRGLWVLAVIVIVLGFVATLFAATAMGAAQAEKRLGLQMQVLEEQIDVLQDQLDARGHADTGESVSGTPNATADGGLTPAQIYARNQQSVVLIETDVATGSGFILTEDGYVVTNYHVVEDGDYISVVLHDRTYYDAELVGYEAGNDVALLKMEGMDFHAVTLGSSDALIVGDQVAAIGNPLGELTSTLTVGYVSAKERDVATDSATINMIQTDCAINSGNSGGPLFNMKGEVVGITTAKYSGMSSSGASIEGIGFAVPMDDVVGILDDLMEFGYVKSGYLGVGVYTMDPAEASAYNLPLGCLVDSVTPGSCADAAGVRPSDIIVGLGGHTIEGYTDLARALREFDGGESTTITVYRTGQGELTFPIILDKKPHEETASQSGDGTMPENGSYEEWYNYFFGE